MSVPSKEADQAVPAGFWNDLRGSLSGTPRDYTSGSLRRAVVLLAIPMVLEMSMQAVFAVVDVFFVGRLGSDAITVVGMTDSLLTLIFAISMGLSMGTTAVVARRIGEDNVPEARVSAQQAMALGAILAFVLGTLGAFNASRLLAIMGAGPSVVKMGSGFTAIMLGGNLTIIWLFLINAIFRGAGDAAIAMRALWLANLVNIALDPLLIFGGWIVPAMGIEGAAIATNIGRGCGIVYQFYRLYGADSRISLRGTRISLDLRLMARLLRISLVGMLQFLVATASWLAIIRILAIFGAAAVAGYTIAVRVIIFALLPSWGMGNAAATLVGQNLGAGKPERAARSVRLTARANMVFLGLVGIVFALVARPVVEIFTSDPEAIRVGVDCLRIVSCSYLFLGLGMVTVQAFNGAGDTTTPTWINLFCYWCVQIPFSYLLARPFGWGPRGVFVAIAIAQTTLALVSTLIFRRGRWKERKV